MTKEQYKALINYIKDKKKLCKLLALFYKYTPILMGLIYMITGLYVMCFTQDKLIRFIFVPLLTFCAVSIFRHFINRERPYDKFSSPPLYEYKAGKGKSFPSRHTASAFIVAMACLYINTSIGIIMIFFALIVGMTRVLSGIHYMSDVIGAVSLALLIAIGCFWLI